MSQSSQLVDDFVFLNGRPPISEFIGFIKVMALNGHDIDQHSLMSEWRAANDRVRELEQAERGLADNPVVGPVDPTAAPLLQAALDNPSAQKTFGAVPVEWCTVELDRLVVHQKFINLRYVGELKSVVPTTLNPIELARFSAGMGMPQSEVKVSQTNMNVFAFTSESEDLRVLDVHLLESSQVSNYVVSGIPVKVLTAVVGFSPNFITALKIGNRLILHNGSHRAFALRDLGITHVPCLVQHISREDELEMVGVPDLKTFPDRYLKSSRPSLLKDYFDPQLRKIVPVVRKHRLVQVQVAWQEGKVPAT
jgi:hypothetical protein